MKNKLFVFRALPRIRDSRTERYETLSQDYSVTLDTWEDNYNYKRKGISKLKVSKEKYSKLYSYPMYLLYLFLFSLFEIKNKDKVICMDLDTFIPILLGSFFKKTVIYFDIVDPIAQTKFRKIPFNIVFDYIEYLFIKYRKFNIVPDTNRINYYIDKLKLKNTKLNYIVVENVPLFNKSNYIKKNIRVDSNIAIGYFGSLEKERGLVELINYVKRNNQIKLIIAGKGNLEEFIKKNVVINKIEFLGAYEASKINELYNMVDFSWSYYSPDNLLHKYASPNKYYEHLAFKTPIIINSIVPQSKIIKEINSGIVISDTLNNDTFNKLYNELVKYQYKLEYFDLWEKLYTDYKINI